MAEVLELGGRMGVPEYLENIEKLDELRSLKGETFFVAKLTLKEGIKSPHELVEQFGMTELQIVTDNHPEYIVFYRIPKTQLIYEILKQVDFDAYFTHPEYYDGKNYVMSFYTHQSTLQTVFQILRDLGIKFKIRSLTTPTFTSEQFFRKLSRKQHEMLLLAGRHGYYKFPRQVSTKELAGKVGISVQMFREHLRKAENKILGEIMEDYMGES